MMRQSKNVLGGELKVCSTAPMTGFYRDGACFTGGEDAGLHTVCAVMTEEFLNFSMMVGNNLSTPIPAYQFPGLKPGDRWCLSMYRWIEAMENNFAPLVDLEATHISVLEFVSLDILKQYALT